GIGGARAREGHNRGHQLCRAVRGDGAGPGEHGGDYRGSDPVIPLSSSSVLADADEALTSGQHAERIPGRSSTYGNTSVIEWTTRIRPDLFAAARLSKNQSSTAGSDSCQV